MCGIIGYIGMAKKANTVLIEGLKALEYRGYDSSGMATIIDNKVNIIKAQGKIKALEQEVLKQGLTNSTMGIAHTRWATHGIPNQINAHPHHINQVTIVHNGIIENYLELADLLKANNYSFRSQTDTEIACAYIDYLYNQNNNDILATLIQAYHDLKGSFAFGIIFEGNPAIYAMRKESPLLIGYGKDFGLIASDLTPLLPYTNKYCVIDSEVIIKLEATSITAYNFQQVKIPLNYQTTDLSAESSSKGIYAHYMLKEINDEPLIIKKLLSHYVDFNNKTFKHLLDLNNYSNIHIIGCGSAYYAAMIGKRLIEDYCRINVKVEIASEYRYANPIIPTDTLVIFISQSGETSDTLAALRLVNERGIDSLAIVNVETSTIANEAKYCAFCKAGVEISVATTKAYISQVMLLILLMLNTLKIHHLHPTLLDHIFEELMALPNHITSIIEGFKPGPHLAALAQAKDVFFLGRGIDYALCMEAALKLKEISYIHCEAYPAGELKHGSIALIEDGTPVIALLSDEALCHKTISNLAEVKARGAHISVFASDNLKKQAVDIADEVYHLVDINPILQPLVSIVPLQLFAYYISLSKGCEIDQPRNLAKSVTVE